MKDFPAKAWFLPQPVAIIGTYDQNGTPNAMNAAWCGTWDANEIIISLGSHATTDNLSRTGCFTVAFATAETMVAADYVGLVSGKRVPDKAQRAGLNAQKAAHVDAPVFTNFPMTLECEVVKKLDESATGCYLIGKIVNIVADDQFLAADGKPDVEKMHLIIFDPIHHTYIALGSKLGDAFAAGNALK